MIVSFLYKFSVGLHNTSNKGQCVLSLLPKLPMDCLRSVFSAVAWLLCNRRKYDRLTSHFVWFSAPGVCFHSRQVLGLCIKNLCDYHSETHSSASGLRLRSMDKCNLPVRRMRTCFGDEALILKHFKPEMPQDNTKTRKADGAWYWTWRLITHCVAPDEYNKCVLHM